LYLNLILTNPRYQRSSFGQHQNEDALFFIAPSLLRWLTDYRYSNEAGTFPLQHL
jgi:hypothetical protein